MRINKSITNENRLLIELTEVNFSKDVGKKPSLKLHFKAKKEDRLFPLETTFHRKEDASVCISGKAAIHLPSVFLKEVDGDTVSVVIELFYEAQRELIGNDFQLEASYFNHGKRIEEKKVTLFRAISSLFLIPIAIFSSLVSKKRGRELVVAANQYIKKRTGISFSLREFKTGYFKRHYNKFSSLPICSCKVLFLSERRMEEGGNLFLILNHLKEDKTLKLATFLVEKTIDKLSFKELKESAYLIATSKLIVLEDFYPQLHALELRKETKVVQLWHACGAFKTFGFSRLFKPGGPEEDSKNHRHYDRSFVSSSFIVPFYSEAFGIPESNVLPLGTPRTDIFFNEAYKEKIREKLYEKFPQFLGKRIVLFAPTFRGKGNKDAYYPKDAFSVEEFMKSLPEDVILIIKHHPFVKNFTLSTDLYKNRVFDLSTGVSINDLLFITDLLITDYSSSIFEAALLSIAMIFYVFDEEEYIEERDIYGDLDSFIPGVKAKNMKELRSEAKRFLDGEKVISYDLDKFKDRYLSALDGQSTRRITDYILRYLEEEGK